MADQVEQRQEWVGPGEVAAASVVATFSGHGIIAGFGVPGRAVAEWMTARGMPFVVIEQNGMVVERCGRGGVPILTGNATDEAALGAAGIQRASLLVLALPNETTVLDAVSVARRLNPALRIIARCTYISGGLEAVRRGADQTVVAEELAAREFVRLLGGAQAPIRASATPDPAPSAPK
jgi:voltage-gated potassium channel Kch